MDIIHYTAIALNWAFTQLGTTAQTLLNLNYSCFTIIVKVFTFIYSNLLSTVQGTTLVLQCYMLDFVAFLEEVGSGINIIGQLFSNAIVHIAASIYNMCNLLIFSIYNIYCHFTTAILAVSNTLKLLMDAFHFGINLIFSASLLLLLSIPNGFIITFEAMCYLIQNLLLLMKSLLFSAANNIYHMRMNCYNAILNLPPKAYVGLLLLVLFYYLHRYIIHSTKSFFNMCAVISILAYIKFIDTSNFILIKLPRSVLLRWRRYRERVHFMSIYGINRREEVPETETSSNWSKFRKLLRQVRLSKFKWLNIYSSENETTKDLLQTLRRQLLEEEGKHLCVICKDQDRNVILLPCKHFCLCEHCCTSLQRTFSGCPICRREILSSINVYV